MQVRRLLSVLSRRRDLQKPTLMKVLSAFRGRGGLKVREETGRLSPPQSVTAFRLRSMVIGGCVPDYIRDLEYLGLLRIIAL